MSCFNNNPIYFSDPLGLEGTNGDKKPKGKGDGGRNGRKKNSNGTIPFEKGDANGENGAPAPNGGTYNEKGGSYDGEAYCPNCGPNQEPTYGIPDESPAPENTRSSSDGGIVGTVGDMVAGAIPHVVLYNAIEGGNYAAVGWALMPPGIEMAYDAYVAPYKMANDIYHQRYLSAGLTYGGHVVAGLSLAAGFRGPKPSGKAITDATKKVFIAEVEQTSSILAGEGEIGINIVYASTESGVTQYVGITNNLAKRAAQHLKSKGIKIEPLLRGLTRSDARAVEQALIEIHGLSKNGGTLLNKINSISKTNPTYGEQLQRGYELLKTIGY
jgi:hypothetical protein